MKLIDLHTHSLHSDGADTPTEVVRRAYEAGLSAMALSDHDCVSGVEEAMAEGKRLGISAGGNGCVIKEATFMGKSSHAGGSPHRGINALYAANLALAAINALRETFQDNSHIRVHPIITKGGDIVNAIPDTVTMECYVRGATMEDIVMVNKKVNRALAASAAAIGAKVHLRDIPRPALL